MSMIAAVCLVLTAGNIPHGTPQITAKGNGVYIDGAPFLPMGYCNHAHMQAGGHRSYDTEVVNGFNSIFTYRGLPGQNEGRWGNTSFADTTAFLDRCASIGVRVLFDFSQNVMKAECKGVANGMQVVESCSRLGKPVPPPPLDVISQAVNLYKNHPAILSWYLIDEPDGNKYPPEFVKAAADLIRSLDKSHPISACFDTTNRADGAWVNYTSSVDVLMADIYPVQTAGEEPCTSAASKTCDLRSQIGDSIRTTIRNTGKPVWFVPEAFGNQEGIQREPMVGEERAMVYTSIIAGATGIFYFAKEDSDVTPPVVISYGHVGSAQPRSSYMWSEARRIAFELNELGPSLISNRTRPAATATAGDVEVGAWEEADGSTLLIAVNLGVNPLPSMTLTVLLHKCPAVPVADVLFGPSTRQLNVSLSSPSATTKAAGKQTKEGGHGHGVAAEEGGSSAPTNVDSTGSSCTVVVSDVVDGLSTRIYRLRPPASRKQPEVVPNPTHDPHATNLIFNGGFEAASSGPGTADGVWATWGGDGSATQFTDTAHARSGRRSMRLTTPAPGKGLRLWTYPVKALFLLNRTYMLSLWARSAGGPLTLNVGMEAMFGKSNVTCDYGSYGQCSYTPQALNVSTQWEEHTLKQIVRFQPDHTGYAGAAGMVSVELIDQGVVWVDDIQLELVA